MSRPSTVDILVVIGSGAVEAPYGCAQDGQRGNRPLLVAIGLDGDATLAAPPPDGPLEVSDIRVEQLDQLTVGGLVRPRFASSAWSSDPNIPNSGHVVYGAYGGNCDNDACVVVVTVPMSRSMVESAGASWTLSTPRLGEDPPEPHLPGYTSLGRAVVDGFAADGPETKSDHWYRPQEQSASFSASAQRVVDSVQQSGTPPEEAFGNVWRSASSAPFVVNAYFDRPRLVAAANRQQFWAGVLVSLAASLAFWALEVARNGWNDSRGRTRSK